MSLSKYSLACVAPHGILFLDESSVDGRLICAHRLAWLMRPLPFRIGITEVDAALKDTAIPSEVNGEEGGGRLL